MSPEQELETQARCSGTFPLRSAVPARCLHGNRAAWRGEGLGRGSLPSRVLLLPWTPCSRTPSQRPDRPGVRTPLAGRSQTRGTVSAWTRAHHLCALSDNAQMHTDAAACPEPGRLSGGDPEGTVPCLSLAPLVKSKAASPTSVGLGYFCNPVHFPASVLPKLPGVPKQEEVLLNRFGQRFSFWETLCKMIGSENHPSPKPSAPWVEMPRLPGMSTLRWDKAGARHENLPPRDVRSRPRLREGPPRAAPSSRRGAPSAAPWWRALLQTLQTHQLLSEPSSARDVHAVCRAPDPSLCLRPHTRGWCTALPSAPLTGRQDRAGVIPAGCPWPVQHQVFE